MNAINRITNTLESKKEIPCMLLADVRIFF
jgi:hypothetical protein